MPAGLGAAGVALEPAQSNVLEEAVNKHRDDELNGRLQAWEQ